MREIPVCPHGTDKGGCTTCFDPYGARPKLGIQVFEWSNFCWRCYDLLKIDKLSREIAKETVQALHDKGLCGFLEAYIGYCFNSRPCEKHVGEKCWKCKVPAISQCSETSQLVCGIPQCDDHPHRDAHGY